MPNKGNALFLILIAVALFAALSYAVTQSGRGGGSVDKEQAILDATQISSYISKVQTAVQRLKVLSCSDIEITFENSVYRGGGGGPFGTGLMIPSGTNTHSPSDDSCDVFAPEGGGVIPEIVDVAPDGTSDWSRTGHPWFDSEPMPGIGSSESDLIMVMPHISLAVCNVYNEGLGLSPDPIGGGAVSSPTEVDLVWGRFDGTYDDCCVSTGIPDGTWSGCYNFNGDSDQNHIFSVLLAR